MQRIPYVFLGLFIVLALNPATKAVAADKYANVHTVAVIYALGDSLTLKKIGLTVFDNEQHVLPIAETDLEAKVIRQVTDAVSPRFTVKSVSVDSSSIETLQPPTIDNREGTPDIGVFVRELPPAGGIDAYIIVKKQLAEDTYGMTNQSLWGMGLYHHEGVFGMSNDAIYAFLEVCVVDAKTGKIIDYGTAHTSDGGFFASGPMQRSDKANWADTATAMTEKQRLAVETQLLSLVHLSLGYALKSANLVESGTPPPSQSR